MQTVKNAVSEDTILAINSANPTEAVIYEQLALRRLAELGVPPEHPPAPPNHAEAPAAASASGVGVLARVIRRMLSIFEPVELVQQVGPGKRPLQRHEWERSKWGWASQNRYL